MQIVNSSNLTLNTRRTCEQNALCVRVAQRFPAPIKSCFNHTHPIASPSGSMFYNGKNQNTFTILIANNKFTSKIKSNPANCCKHLKKCFLSVKTSRRFSSCSLIWFSRIQLINLGREEKRFIKVLKWDDKLTRINSNGAVCSTLRSIIAHTHALTINNLKTNWKTFIWLLKLVMREGN